MTHVIILAAGKGKRMRSERPKVLQPVGGVPMIERILSVARVISPQPLVVVGQKADEIRETLDGLCRFIVQKEQRGTGDAVRCAIEALGDIGADSVVVLPGDHPLLTAQSLYKVIGAREASNAAVTLATVLVPDFDGVRQAFDDCGRILRDEEDRIVGIVERKDATEEGAKIHEVNVSTYCFRGEWLRKNVARLAAENAAGEFYLTDLVALAVSQGETVRGVRLEDEREGMGVNTPAQLMTAESYC